MSNADEYAPWLREVVAKQVFDRERGTIAAELCCPPAFPPFAGHFPGQPVLPAVLQLLIVRILAGDLLQLSLDPVKTGGMKFKGMIRPEERIMISVALEQIDGLWNAVFNLRNPESVVAAGNIFFRVRQG